MSIPVGSASVDITPPLTIPYLGYVPRQSYPTGVHDPLTARAIVFGEGADRIGVLSADLLGLGNHILGPGRHVTNELRARVADRTGLCPERLLVACTHAHSSPETLGITRLLDVPAAAPWLEVLMDQLASAVAMACQNAVPCTLKADRGAVLGVAVNRRPGCAALPLEDQAAGGRLDPSLQLLVCEDDEGYARHVLLNFACHPVTVQVQPLISADYPGAARAIVERELGGCRTCLFLQGAAGNLNPVRGDTRDWRDVALYGAMVGGEALLVAARLLGDDTAALTDGPLLAATERVVIPPRSLPDRAECEAALAECVARERTARDDEVWNATNHTHQAREALDLIDRYSEPQEAEVQVLRIGDMAVAGVPGELFCEWGFRIKNDSPAPYTFVAELANGWVGYLLNEGGFTEGGYETSHGTWTQTGEDGAAMLSNAVARLLHQLWR
jgi:neutral ceramidase